MESPVRPYNSNSPGEPRRRSGRGGKRSEATARKSTQTVKLEPQEIAIELTPQALGVEAEVTPAEPDIQDAETQGQAEPGPAITIDDFEEIFSRFQTPLTNFVFRLVGNREQAYDLTQDVFVKAYRALSSGTTIQAAALSSWLYRIASNTATDALRRRRLISWLPLSLFNEDRGVGAGMPGADGPNTNQQGYSEENFANATSAFSSGYDGGRFEQRVADREIVERVLRRLPEKYASCLLLYEHEGFSCAEIADILSVSPSAVKMRLMRARERFITLYQQEVAGK
jgi:RNA polymerase sigma-70 factor (ECF subfamily)